MSNIIAKDPIKEPRTFNYGVKCSPFDLTGPVPKVWLVDYQAMIVQRRLPGGTFQASDLFKALDSIIAEPKYNKDMALIYLYAELQSFCRPYGDTELPNEIFNEFTAKLLEKVQAAKISEELFDEIIKQTHLNTVRKELKEEIFAGRIGEIFLTSHLQCGGGHHKIGYTCMDLDAPIKSSGSPDEKILRSYQVEIDGLTAGLLFNGHSNDFQRGLDCVVQHNPKLDYLKKYITASR